MLNLKNRLYSIKYILFLNNLLMITPKLNFDTFKLKPIGAMKRFVAIIVTLTLLTMLVFASIEKFRLVYPSSAITVSILEAVFTLCFSLSVITTMLNVWVFKPTLYEEIYTTIYLVETKLDDYHIKRLNKSISIKSVYYISIFQSLVQIISLKMCLDTNKDPYSCYYLYLPNDIMRVYFIFMCGEIFSMFILTRDNLGDLFMISEKVLSSYVTRADTTDHNIRGIEQMEIQLWELMKIYENLCDIVKLISTLFGWSMFFNTAYSSVMVLYSLNQFLLIDRFNHNSNLNFILYIVEFSWWTISGNVRNPKVSYSNSSVSFNF